jgi:hypothetical protein
MNAATANLHIYLSEGEQDNDEKFTDAIKEEDAREGGVRVNMLSDNEGGEDSLEEDTSMIHDNPTLFSKDYNSSVDKVSPGVFDAAHSNKFEEPGNFKRNSGTKMDHQRKV